MGNVSFGGGGGGIRLLPGWTSSAGSDRILGGSALPHRHVPIVPPTPTGGPSSAPVVDVEGDHHNSPQTYALTGPVAAGQLLSVFVGDGFGYAPRLSSVSDSQGNTYTVDSAVNQADGDGSAYVASSIITTPLTTADTLTIVWTGGAWAHFHVVATPFGGASIGLDVAGTPHGNYEAGSIDASITPSVNDLLIGYAVWQHGPVTDDSGHGWTEFLNLTSDPQNTVLGVWQIVTSTSGVHYVTSGTALDTLDGAYSASVICAYH